MDLNFRTIRAFVFVAKTGSFTKAAAALHVSQPTLTVQIKKLEEALGVKLLDRNSRSVQLTRIGADMLPVLRRTLEDMQSIVDDAHEQRAGHRGTVRIASLPSFSASLLAEVIARSHQLQEGLSFLVRDAVAKQVIDLVRTEQVDLGITGGAMVHDELDVLHQASDRLCVIFPAGHAFARRRRVRLEDLLDQPLVLTDPATSVRAAVDAAFLTLGREPQVSCETTYMMTAVAMVKAGLGCTILPASAREIQAEPTLGMKVVDHPGFVRPIALIKKRGRTLSPACANFAALCCKHWPRK